MSFSLLPEDKSTQRHGVYLNQFPPQILRPLFHQESKNAEGNLWKNRVNNQYTATSVSDEIRIGIQKKTIPGFENPPSTAFEELLKNFSTTPCKIFCEMDSKH